MKFCEDTISSEYIYKGRVVTLRKDIVRLHDGSTSKREIIEHNGGVGIVAVNEKNEIILVRQYRKPYDEVIIEIPAGKLEKGEKPADCAVRELEEETGNIPEKLELLNIMYPSPGYTSEKIYIYFSKDLKTGKVHLDEGENVETVMVPVNEAVQMILDGKINDSKTIIGILMVKDRF